MALSVFDDKARPPADAEVAAVLGRAAPLWTSVQADIAAKLPDIAATWGFTNKSSGWSLRVKQGERIIVYLTPCAGHFLASLALGEKAVAAARADGHSPALHAIIDAAPKYVEGRGVRFAVKTKADATHVVKLAMFKAAS